MEKPLAAGKIVLTRYLKHTQLPEPFDPRLSPKYQVCNLSMRISRARLASEISLSNLISKLLKSDLVITPCTSESLIPLRKADELDKVSLRTGSLTETDRERQKHTANVLMVFQGYSVIQKQNTVM